MVAAFAEDAELVFEGIPVGPFAGREAIGEAYAAQPPDDEVVLLDGDGTYAWAKEPRVPAGRMFLTEREGEIAHLKIRYDH
jgi:steroid delta-isomerase